MQHASIFEKSTNLQDRVQIPMNDSLLSDYCQMLTPDNSKEIQAFALQSLDPMIDDVIKKFMASTDMLMSVFSIIEYYSFPFEIQ